ncbi:MAG TPA: cytochrome c [Gemmatimonadales bacterium]|jgi:mono/diheme cytochrome c family protein
MKHARLVSRVIVPLALGAIGACNKAETPSARPAADTAPPAAEASATEASQGQKVFARTCQMCHQMNGQGIPGTYPPQAGSPYINGDKAKLIRIALNGLQGPVTVEEKNYNGVMPPQRAVLSDSDLAAVLTYVRGHFGNTASAVTPDEVAHERGATANRTALWTIDALNKSR